ncbi:MAG: hypothetical protein ABEJ24_00660, partial [Candidatus Magasanikbacteria bacterium]
QNGANRFTLSSKGKIGINTTSPDAALEVNGDVSVSNTLFTDVANQRVAINTSSPSTGFHVNATEMRVENSGGHFTIQDEDNSNSSIYFLRGGAMAFRNSAGPNFGFSFDDPAGNTEFEIKNNGNVELPNDNQNFLLGAGQDSSITFDGSNTIMDYDKQNAGTTGFRLQQNGTNRLVAGTGGNIGINTTSPDQALEIKGDLNVSSTLFAQTKAGNGKVGINTNSPGETLHLVDDATLSGIRFENTGGSGRTYVAGSVNDGIPNPQLDGGEFIISDNTAPATRFIMETNGSVSIGSTTPESILPKGSLHVTNGAVCVTSDNNCSPDSISSGQIAAEASLNTNADLAEKYKSSQDLNQGELVKLDKGSSLKVERTSSSYDRVIGVVSTEPGVLLSATQSGYPVALSGRVPTLVSDANGPIDVGDPIAASSDPGVGMKATSSGQVVGFALESFTGSGTSTIEVFVTPEYRYPEKQFKITQNGNIGIGTTTPDAKLDVAGKIQADNLKGGATSLSVDSQGNIIRSPSDKRLKEDI